MTQTPERRVHPADWGSVAVVLAVAVAQVRFMALDARLPQDMGLYFAELPGAWQALATPDTWGEALAVVGTPGGWYVALLALLMRVVGRAPEVIQVVDTLWVTGALALGALGGRRLGGPRAGLAAVSLLAAPAMVVVAGRTSWIHVPELTLVSLALYALLTDPELRTRRWTLAAAAGLGLAVALRPSALVWVLTLLPLVPRAWRASRARVLAIVLATAVGALPLLADLSTYLVAKLEARPRYAEHMPGLLEQLHTTVGAPVLLVGAAGLVLAWGHLRRDHALVLSSWLVLPLVLVGIFLAGLDNFPFLLAGLALVGGVGLAQRPWGAALAAGTFAALYTPQYTGMPQGAHAPWYRLTGQSTGPGPANLWLPYRGFAADEVLALLYSTCDPIGQCTVVVDQGLFRPYSEDPGRHELFLAGADQVHLVWISGGDVPGHLDALANYDCGEHDLPWRSRYPDSITALITLVERNGLEPAWEGDTQPGCRLLWLTPGGEVPRPELLPPAVTGGAPGDAYSPDGSGVGRPTQGPPLGPDGKPLLGPDGEPLPPPPDGADLLPPEGAKLPLPPLKEEPEGPPPEGAPRPDGVHHPAHLGEVPTTRPEDDLEAHRVRPGHSTEDR